MGKFFPQERRNSRRGGAQWIFLTPAWTAVASLTPSSVEYLESNPLTRNYLSMLLPRLVSSSRVSFSRKFFFRSFSSVEEVVHSSLTVKREPSFLLDLWRIRCTRRNWFVSLLLSCFFVRKVYFFPSLPLPRNTETLRIDYSKDRYSVSVWKENYLWFWDWFFG